MPKTLTVEEVRDLLRAMDGTSRVDRRDKVLFHLCYVAGLGIGEAVSLKLSSLDLDEGTLRVIGKGSKERRIYLKSYTVGLLEKYIEESGGDSPARVARAGGCLPSAYLAGLPPVAELAWSAVLAVPGAADGLYP